MRHQWKLRLVDGSSPHIDEALCDEVPHFGRADVLVKCDHRIETMSDE
jgi:hypothetical protein